jgi:hypothetical protein
MIRRLCILIRRDQLFEPLDDDFDCVVSWAGPLELVIITQPDIPVQSFYKAYEL